MKISVARTALDKDRSELLAVLVPAKDWKAPWLSAGLRGALDVPVKLKDFAGDKLQKLLAYHGKQRVLFVGLGDKKKIDAETLRRAAAAATQKARQCKAATVSLALPPLATPNSQETGIAVGEGLVLGGYHYHGLKAPDKKLVKLKSAAVYLPKADSKFSAGLKRGSIGAEAQCFARDLGNSPGNVATPAMFAKEARKIGAAGGVTCKVIRLPELKKRKFGGLLGVNAGSTEPPVFLEMEYRPRSYKKTVCLVGKGLTFDSGGISLKPPGGMEEMKFDMCGGATVLATMKAIGRLRPAGVRVFGLVPSTDNMPSGSALKPGDVIKSYGGITIEVINTDAEGRLILADALGRAQELKPDYTIDLATLTGACVVALGHRATGLFSASDDLRDRLLEASKETHEPAWPLPHWDDYQEEMRSTVADIKNAGGRWGGAVTAFAFLKKFAGDLKHAHLDIAGTGWDMPKREYYEGGATGTKVRTLLRFLENLN